MLSTTVSFTINPTCCCFFGQGQEDSRIRGRKGACFFSTQRYNHVQTFLQNMARNPVPSWYKPAFCIMLTTTRLVTTQPTIGLYRALRLCLGICDSLRFNRQYVSFHYVEDLLAFLLALKHASRSCKNHTRVPISRDPSVDRAKQWIVVPKHKSFCSCT